MKGRTCMITGATSGIGRATALDLARRGADLVLVCRDPERGRRTAEKIAAEGGKGRVELLMGDLSSQADIRRLAAEYLASDRPLHVLINNAGVVCTQRTLTVDGIETVFAVNHLAYFLLSVSLLDRLRASAPARIVNVASDAHKFGAIDFDDLGGERGYRTMAIYGRSKLANILFTYELARRLEGSGVTANCLHPGAVGTQLGTNNGAWARALVRLLRPFFRSPERGAETVIHLASSSAVASISGQYFYDCKPIRSSKASYDLETAQRLWRVSCELTGWDGER